MAQRKRPRSVEHQEAANEIARAQGYDAGFRVGFDAGFDAGYIAGQHGTLDTVSELMDGDAHE